MRNLEYVCETDDFKITYVEIMDGVNLEVSLEEDRDVSLLVEALSDYGETAEEILGNIKGHLDGCVSCREEYNEWLRRKRDIDVIVRRKIN